MTRLLGASAFAETGSHPSDHARAGHGASRIDPARKIEFLRMLAEIEDDIHAGIDGWTIAVAGHDRSSAFRRMADELAEQESAR